MTEEIKRLVKAFEFEKAKSEAMELADIRSLTDLFLYVRTKYQGVPKRLILPDELFDRILNSVPMSYEVFTGSKPAFNCPVGQSMAVRVERKNAPQYVADVIDLS